MKDASKYQEALRNLDLPAGKSTDQAWEDIQHRLSDGNIKVVRFEWKKYVAYAAAAAVIAFGIFLIVPGKKPDQLSFATAKGEFRSITLPDGSEVLMNAASKIAYASEWSDERELQLDGEAFFKVKKGSRFTVHTPQGDVQVLGTSFNVKARGGEFEVECHTGKVAVTHGNQRVEITPGELADLNSEQLQKANFVTDKKDWRAGEISFNDEPLQNVFDELSRQFNVTIQNPDVSSNTYSGKFSTHDLNEALQKVCWPYGFEYHIKSDMSVVITTKAD